MATPKQRKSGKVAGDKSPIVAQLPAACADEKLAVEFMEKQRWGDCPCCPRCGDTNVKQMRNAQGERNARFLWRCYGCKRQFTVRINSVYEDSRIPMRHWVFAFWACCASKKGVSALQIKRQTGLNYRSALFMLNRIRHAMTPQNPPPLGGTIETDEVYIGGMERGKAKPDGTFAPNFGKMPVLGIVQRDGELRMKPLPQVTYDSLKSIIAVHVAPGAVAMTDGHTAYPYIFQRHQHFVVHHSKGEYVNAENPAIHTNCIEGAFSLLRKRLDGTHHSVSWKYLYRYCNEAAFVYTHRKVDDGERTVLAIKAASGKRLTYEQALEREAV